MKELVLLCGPSGSGKSTFARTLEERGYVCVSIDRLTGERAAPGSTPQAAPYDPILAELALAHTRDYLLAGQRVVVDETLCHRERRDAYREIATDVGVEHDLVYFDTPRDIIHARVAARFDAPGYEAVPIPPDLLDRFLDGFNVPGPDELTYRSLTAADGNVILTKSTPWTLCGSDEGVP